MNVGSFVRKLGTSPKLNALCNRVVADREYIPIMEYAKAKRRFAESAVLFRTAACPHC